MPSDQTHEREHALLSPSSAARWMSCPASVMAIEELNLPKEAPSEYAQEGTIAHALAEIRAASVFGLITQAEAKKRLKAWREEHGIILAIENEMWGYVDIWINVLRERMDEGAILTLEQRLDSGIPGVWGTTDSAIISGNKKHLYILDFKYGAGVAVNVEGNEQLRCYALGVLDEVDILDTVEDVTMIVVQPRIGNGYVGEETLTADELRAWREEATALAELAMTPQAHFGPSEKACRWCPLSGNCQAQIEAVFGDVDFESDPLTIPLDERGEMLAALPRIKDWIKAFEESSLHLAYDKEKTIPGWKVVMSGGRRGCQNEEETLKVLDELGYKLDDVTTRKVVGVGALEALLGKDDFKEHLAKFHPKSAGKPSLVPDEDKRPALDRASEAAALFGTIDEEDIL